MVRKSRNDICGLLADVVVEGCFAGGRVAGEEGRVTLSGTGSGWACEITGFGIGGRETVANVLLELTGVSCLVASGATSTKVFVAVGRISIFEIAGSRSAAMTITAPWVSAETASEFEILSVM